MTLALGARLGPYEIAGPLGKGGMGEVYRARDTRLGRDVAVKVLPAATAADAATLTRFEYEARAVASLNHPNILALYDVGNDGGIAYAVTELLDGETLRDLLARAGALPARRALEIAVQFARGLAAAHGRGIVHRDLKPENLFLTADGRLKILDFGLATPDTSARMANDAETRVATEAGLLLGTAGYMAPEQIRGEPVSARADVFSYGLVVREVLAGSNPFTRGTTADTLAAILRDDPGPLPAVAGLPPLAAALLDRCLEKRPEMRTESVGDLAFVLEAMTATGSVRGGEAPRLDDRRLVRRAAGAAAALAMLLSLALAAYVGWSAGRTAVITLAGDLSRADTVVRRAYNDRLERLQLHARVTAALPTLNALFETNAASIRDYLLSYQQRTPGAPLLIALGRGGHLLAHTGNADLPPDESSQWLADLAAASGAATIAIGGVPHLAAVAHAEAGGTIFGTILAAAPLDDGFAQVLRDAMEAETVLLDAQRVTGTSLRAGQVPWRSLAEFRDAGGFGSVPLDVALGATQYRAYGVSLSERPAVAAVVLASRGEAAAQYRGIQAGMVGLGAALAAALLLAGWVYSRRAPPDQRSL
jgi:hypothetical protein